MPTNQRNQSLQALGQISDDQRYVLGNARCLSEGVDVPTLDGIAFIDPRNSEIDIVQAVGRAIRLADGKETGTIVIPVFIPKDKDPDAILNSSPFKKIWAVINALRSHDDALAIELDGFRKQLGRRGTVGKPPKIHFDLPATVSADFERALETKLIEATTASWEFWLGLLEAYKEEFGDCRVLKGHKTDSGYNLASWVGDQRKAFKKNQLTPGRLQRLNDLGFIWDVGAEYWEQGFSELAILKDVTKHCRVRRGYKTASDFPLGTWVQRQRSDYKKGKLTPDRIQRLDDLGFIWDVADEYWEQGFSELTIYKDEYNDCLVQFGHKTASEFPLSNWVVNQSKAYKKSQLTPERIQRLNDLGFVWDPLAAKWERGFSELTIYKGKYNHCRVQSTHKTASGYKLGIWLSGQREAYTKGQLTPERIQRLEQLGVILNPYTYKWEQGLSELANYMNANNHSRVPATYKTASGYKLGVWMRSKRVRKDKLTPERIQRLDDLGFVWDVSAEQWEQGASELAIFKDENNHCRVPERHKTASDYKLGSWVSVQRKKKYQLTPERIQRLEDQGFVWKVK